MSLAYRLLCDRVKIRTWVRFQMSTFQHGSKRSRSSNACNLFLRANEHWDRGELKSAFRLFLRAARAGDSGARVNLGYFYDSGLGVKPNRDLALYWYRRAYRQRSERGGLKHRHCLARPRETGSGYLVVSTSGKARRRRCQSGDRQGVSPLQTR
jgi:TPR repeat protein